MPEEERCPFRVHVAYAAVSDVGLKREHNEDSFLVAPSLRLCVVADGMGGHLGGETASRLLIESVYRGVAAQQSILEQAVSSADVARCPVATLLGAAFRDANAVIRRTSRASHDLTGMGTTATALLFHGERAMFAHVGDSRAYVVRDGRATQLTHDHTIVADQLREGHISEADARRSRFKNVITRCVGSEEDIDVDLGSLAIEDADVFVLCSDGLTNLVTDLEIADIVSVSVGVSDGAGAGAGAGAGTGDGAGDARERAAHELVATAKRRGGDDNITVMLCAVSVLDATVGRARGTHSTLTIQAPYGGGAAASSRLSDGTNAGAQTAAHTHKESA